MAFTVGRPSVINNDASGHIFSITHVLEIEMRALEKYASGSTLPPLMLPTPPSISALHVLILVVTGKLNIPLIIIGISFARYAEKLGITEYAKVAETHISQVTKKFEGAHYFEYHNCLERI